MNKTEIPAAEAAHAAKQASFALAAAPGKARSSALLAVAAALRAKANMVFKANEIDMRQAEKEGLAAPALKRLKFDAHKLEDVCAGLEQLAAMEDPIGREQLRTELADGLVLSRVSCPIGVIGVIFESRPDALIQIGGLCLKSGNAVLLKGGREAMRTNEALFDILRDASVATGMPDGWCGLLTTREDVSVMLKMDEDIDLISPRGSNAFVRYIMENSNIPVLGHSDGVCHIYVDADCDAQMAARIVADAKTGTAQNSIDFKVGPDKALQDAHAATQEAGLDLSKNASFDMGYQGIADGTDKIKLKTSGNVARVTRDIFHVTGTGDQVASITWTVEPGAHTA